MDDINNNGAGDDHDPRNILEDHPDIDLDDDDDPDDLSVRASVLNGAGSSEGDEESLFVGSDANTNPSSHSNSRLGSDEENSYATIRRQRDNYRVALERYDNLRINLERQVRNLIREKRELSADIDRLRNGNPAPEPWPIVLREWFSGNRLHLSWGVIYKSCCKQENMSELVEVTHPSLVITKKVVERNMLRRYNIPLRGRYRGPWPDLDFIQNENLLNIILPSRNSRPLLRLLEPAPFPFERLPPDIQALIFRRLLVKKTLTHCISRLDPANPPVDFPPEDARRENLLLHRFHFGKNPCFIPGAWLPREILSPLLVSKRWYFVGVHVFYGANTFAFSSLGELGKFMTGIGQARAERIVNVELMWHGNLMPRASRLNEQSPLPVETSSVSQRTVPLTWFTKTRRLRTLVVHIAESEKRRMRRKYEMQEDAHYYQDYAGVQLGEQSDDEKDLDVFQRMVRRTDLHSNYRKYRGMRTTHGMDYLYQLRGMNWIRFYEASSERDLIRDWSFMKDLVSVVTLPKPPSLFRQSQLKNLSKLTGLRNWQPSEDDFRIIETFYDETHVGDEFLGGSEITPSERGTVFSDGSLSTLSSSSSDSSGDGNGPAPNNYAAAGDVRESDVEGSDSNDYMEIDNYSVASGDQEMPDANSISSSRSSQHSITPSSGGDDGPDDAPINTQQTSIPSQMNPIDLTMQDDDGSDSDRQSEPGSEVDRISSSDELFVPWGSISGRTTTGRSSDGLFVPQGSVSAGGTTRGHRTEVSDAASVIDLTMDDSESEDGVDFKSEDDDAAPGGDDVLKEEGGKDTDGSSGRSSLKHLMDQDSEGESDAPSPKRPRGVASDPGLQDDDSSAAGGSDVLGLRPTSI